MHCIPPCAVLMVETLHDTDWIITLSAMVYIDNNDTVCALLCFILFGFMTTEYVHIVDNLNIVNKEASESRV